MALKALQLNNHAVKRVLQHEALVGKKIVGRGAMSAVFEGSKPSTVYKLTVDSMSYWMANCYSYGARHAMFPKIGTNYGMVGEVRIGNELRPIYLYEMERLQKLQPGSEAKKLAFKIHDVQYTSVMQTYVHCAADIALFTLQNMIRDKSLGRRVMNALIQLEEFCCNYPGSLLDMHMGNFMQRKNGDLVFSDPLLDAKVYEARLEEFRMRRY